MLNGPSPQWRNSGRGTRVLKEYLSKYGLFIVFFDTNYVTENSSLSSDLRPIGSLVYPYLVLNLLSCLM